jgi:acetyl esterase
VNLVDRLSRLALRLPPSLLLRLAGGRPEVVAGRVLNPALQLAAARAARQRQLWQLSPVEARTQADRAFVVSAGDPRPLESIQAIAIPGPGGPLPARVYRPRGLAGPAPLLLYFHQGGFVLGTLDWCEAFCTLLADVARCVVVSVDYRLAPEHRFPASHDDALAAWRWAAAEAASVGADPERLAVGGDSAGGTLAAYLAHEALRSGGLQPVFQLLIYPWVLARADTPSTRDFANAWPVDRPLMDWFLEHAFEKPEQQRDWRVNLLREPDFSRLAPAHVACAGFDPLCDEGRLYAEKLASAGRPVTHRCYGSLTHSFTAMGALPAALRAQQEIAAELARGLGAR